jgi:uncharacterized protein with NRDE domain
MCTLSYIPQGPDSFLWTQNRDESPLRNSEGLEFKDDVQLVFPKEPLSGGSWIAMSENNRVVSLLNGAFVQHPYSPSTKRSRGLVVLDFFDYPDASAFFGSYDFEDIEPFTMIIYDKGDLWEFRWDKTKKYIKKLNPDLPYLWSATTLYPKEIKQQRQQWFAGFLESNPQPDLLDVMNFHRTAGTGNLKYDLIMDRGVVKTVSITSISKTSEGLDMTYYDLQNEKQSEYHFS